MRSDPMRSWEEKINGETEEKKMNRQADFTDGSSSFDDGFDKLYEKIKTMYRDDELETVKRAYDVAKEHHKNQLRQSGEPYIIHPIAVASILADLGMDSQSVAAALLHDTVEDTDVTKADIEREFGDEIAQLVDGVTKLAKVPTETKAEAQAENIRKMLLAMSNDIRVIIIKLADRLHNMRTIGYVREEKRRETALETLEIYAPIAHRLGIRTIKEELEDRAIICLDPVAYKEIEDYLNSQSASRKEFLDSIIEKIKERVDPLVSGCKVEGRIKSVHGIYRKMYIGGKTFDEIYDIYAVRIIVESVIDCYNCLGVIHDMFRPIPNRFKDYISTPKPNMYQSLHTTLIASNGQPFEIQIRTYEMHRTAEYGIAAHWKYKEGKSGETGNESEEAKLSWLRQILEWQKDTSDSKEFLKLLKSDLDLFSDHVYCFTPSGDVKNLPAGSTPIDFAYSIHSAVGNKMIGARVNGKLVTIDYKINNGDVIEVLTSQNSKGPSRDWLNIVKSSQARNKINQWFKNELKEDNVMKGRDMFLTYCKTKNINTTDLLTPEYEASVMHKYGFQDWDSVLAAIGHGALKEGQVINRMQELYARDHKKQITDEELLANIQENSQSKPVHIKSKSGIVVKGIHDVAVRFSRCCNPVPGDEIVGFVTRGRGVSIHRTDCVNIINLPEMDRVRLIEAEWQPEDTKSAEKYLAEIIIYAHNRSGLLADISKTFTEKNIDIQSMNTRTSKQGIATMVVTFEIGGRNELTAMIDKLRMIENVIDIERTTG